MKTMPCVNPWKGILAVLLIFLGLAACAAETALEPAPGVMVRGDEEWAVGGFEGVLLKANPDAWTGYPEIIEKVTPMKVRIINNHGSAVRIQYNLFSLISSTGKRYSVLPPYEIDATVKRSLPARGPYGFTSREFFVAPHHRGFYPGIPSATAWGYRDPCYYSCYRKAWMELELPTDRMLSRALPEGDIQPGGEVTGFLYLEKVENEDEVELHMDLKEAEDGYVFGRITLPFFVEE